MKAYVQTKPGGDFYNVNAFLASVGFAHLGWEVRKCTSVGDMPDRDPEAVAVGGIGYVRGRLEQLGLTPPARELDYPEELVPYLGRRVWSTTIQELFDRPDDWNVFIKPRDETKKFTGKVVKTYRDFLGLVETETPLRIWCSEPVTFVTEWRCYIRYGQILDIRQYRGAWDSRIDLQVVNRAIGDFKTAPAAYALDFGVDDHGEMKLVEVNDGHSLGAYGMGAVSYAKFLSARWAELTGTTDHAHF